MFGDFGKMLKLLSDVKTKLPALQEKLAATEYTAGAGSGAVVATVNGRLQLVKIKIDPAVAGDSGKLEEYVQVAVSGAQAKAAQETAAAIKELTGGVQLPGMDGLLG